MSILPYVRKNVKDGVENKKAVFVAMSGGVDSSVAALLLKNQGYDVTGVFMRCFNLDGCAVRDAEDARRVANHLQIPFYTFDFEEEYKRDVVDYMVAGYRDGITPNPDVMCNKEIKFGLFLKKALELGADYIATGHYVRLSRIASRNNSASPLSSLCAAKDTNKDQSYFLWTLTQEQLKHCLFPIGDYLKSEVREIARKAGLPMAEKKDSQGICFLGKVALADFLKEYIPASRGRIVTTDGRLIGTHDGAQFYTIGQRHLGITDYVLGKRGRDGMKPRYVVQKDVKTNTVIVAEGDDNPALYKRELKLTRMNFIGGSPFSGKVLARVRYRQPLAKARIMNNESGIKDYFPIHNSKFLILKFDRPVKFIAPGQSAVFYLPVRSSAEEGSDGFELLGGGVIF